MKYFQKSSRLGWLKEDHWLTVDLNKTMWWSQVWLSLASTGLRLVPIFSITAWCQVTARVPGQVELNLSYQQDDYAEQIINRKTGPDPPKDLPPARVSHELGGIRIGFWSRYVWSLVFEESAIHYKLNICSCLAVAGRAVSHYWQGPVVITKLLVGSQPWYGIWV